MKRDLLPEAQPTVAVDASAASSEFARWLDSPVGRYLLDWEQHQFDDAVADIFGYIAVQCGLPMLHTLRASRVLTRVRAAPQAQLCAARAQGEALPEVAVSQFEELPFANQSVDLLLLPHVLDYAGDPHQVLREADRVLRSEGRLILTGLNPVSLWGARQLLGAPVRRSYLPAGSALIAMPRLRDWLKLLSFEVERTRFGLYVPACRSEPWLNRWRWIDGPGDRWWPICGAAYMVSVVKRVRGVRLIGPAWRSSPARAPAAVTAPQRYGEPVHSNRADLQS